MTKFVHRDAYTDRLGTFHPSLNYEYGNNVRLIHESEFHPRSSGPRSVPRHPRAPFAELLGQCSRCHLILSVALRRNGIPNGLVTDFTDGHWKSIGTNEYEHLNCEGRLQMFGVLPRGFVLSTLWRHAKDDNV